MQIELAHQSEPSHLVLIPSYNTGAKLPEVIAEACLSWHDVWVIIDGSTDGSRDALTTCASQYAGLRIISRRKNGGKGAAVLDGLRLAAAAGFTHVLIMDADGQHPASSVREFIMLSRKSPQAMILGQPVFDGSAPRARVIGRRLANILTRIETEKYVGDSLFGFRVYPLAVLLELMESSPRMRRFDFDTEVLVRLSWSGVRAVMRPVPVRYFRVSEGGVSHFRYVRDNIMLAAMHARLMGEVLQRKRLVRTQFFFEKKNQKTFTLLVDAAGTNDPYRSE